MYLSKENILKFIDQRSIMERYFPFQVSLNKFYCNPYRYDRTPGCYFNWTRMNNLVFFDNAQPNSGGDCFKVCMMENKCDFYTALKIINEDFKLGLLTSNSSNITPYRQDYLKRIGKYQKQNKMSENKDKKPIVKTHFKVFTRKWNKIDKEYWARFGITIPILKKYNVYPVARYAQKKHDDYHFRLIFNHTEDLDPCYCFVFETEVGQKVKLYRPLIENKRYKWAANVNDELQGLAQLPETGDLLVITSSLKDVMTLVSHGIYAIAPQSEVALLDKDLLEEFSKRFNKVVVTLDADATGVKYGKKQANVLESIVHVPLIKIKEAKDFAEIRDLHKDSEEFKKYLNHLYDITLPLKYE